MPKYRVLVGINYAGVRREPGEAADDIPRQSIGWLTEQGIIEAVDDTGKTTTATTTPSSSSGEVS